MERSRRGQTVDSGKLRLARCLGGTSKGAFEGVRFFGQVGAVSGAEIVVVSVRGLVRNGWRCKRRIGRRRV